MIKINETKVHSVKKNTHRELSVTFLIKPEDYTAEIENLFYDLKNNGNLWAFVFNATEFTEDTGKSESQVRNEMISKLAFLMNKYAEKEWEDIESLKQTLYNKYWVTSRTQLSNEQLKKELDSFEAGLYFNN